MTAFGSAFLKSRSSASFPAEVKDFVAPQPVNISNCGTITMHKVTENGDADFNYTTTGGLTRPPSPCPTAAPGRTASVLAGAYSVTESTPPAGWTLKSLDCTATGEGTSVTTDAATASIAMAGGGMVDCTYTNHINRSPKHRHDAVGRDHPGRRHRPRLGHPHRGDGQRRRDGDLHRLHRHHLHPRARRAPAP